MERQYFGTYRPVLHPRATVTFIGGIKLMALQEFVWVTVGVVWIHTYIRGIVLEYKTNDESYRSLSKASAILLVIWFGWQMVWWLSAFTFLNNEWFVSVLSNQPENPPLWWLISVNFGWSIGAIAISVLFIGEVFRSVKRERLLNLGLSLLSSSLAS